MIYYVPENLKVSKSGVTGKSPVNQLINTSTKTLISQGSPLFGKSEKSLINTKSFNVYMNDGNQIFFDKTLNNH